MKASQAEMGGKVVVVTGANTGIGFETAKEMARRGAKVILGCRTENRALAARDSIVDATGSQQVIYKHLDLNSFKSVRAFADDILKTETSLHVLINNAGMGDSGKSISEDNIPIIYQTNYYGPFLLTILLLPLLRDSAPSRIVNVSSILHKQGKIDFETFGKRAQAFKSYCNTKLANILFTIKLSKALEGSGITVNALHPGVVATEIFRDRSAFTRCLLKKTLKTPEQGAQTTIHLAAAPELASVSGKYFSGCKQTKTSKLAQNQELADRLWEHSRLACSCDETNGI